MKEMMNTNIYWASQCEMRFHDITNWVSVFQKSVAFTLFVLLGIHNVVYSQESAVPCNTVSPWISSVYPGLSAEVNDNVPSLLPLCLGGVVGIGNLVNDNLNDFVTIEITGIGCNATIGVSDASNVYPAGTWAGFNIGTAGLLDVSVASSVVITTWNNGVLQETYNAGSSLVGLNAVNFVNNRTDVGFVTTQDFDEIRITYQTLLGVLFTGRVYHAVLLKNCSNYNVPCNETTPMIQGEHPVLVGSAGVTGVSLGNVLNPQNLVDDDVDNFASIVLPVGILASGYVSVKNYFESYPAGYYAGFSVANANVLGLDLLDFTYVSTYLDGVLQEVQFGSGLLISAGLLSGSNQSNVGFVTTLPFDEVRLSINQTVGVDLGVTNVYHAVLVEYCEGPGLNCNEQTSITTSDFPVSIAPQLTGITGALCVGCSRANLDNVLDSDTDSYANVTLVAGVDVQAAIAVKDQLTIYPDGTFAGFEIQNLSLLDLDILNFFQVSTYLDGVFQESSTSFNLVVSESALLNGINRKIIGFQTTQPFNTVRIRMIQPVGLSVGTTRIYRAVLQSFCPGDPLPCNTPTAMAAPSHPVFINSLNTGIESLACIGCSVNNTENLINADSTTYATIELTAGVIAEGSISVKNGISVYDNNEYVGFEIQNPILADVNAFQYVSVNTYLDGVLQESRGGIDLLVSVSAFLLNSTGRAKVGFVTSMPFDEVQIVLDGVVSVNLGATRIYNLYIQNLCEVDLVCDETYFLSNPEFPVVINADRTGVFGLACIACEIEDVENVITADETDFSTIQVVAGVGAWASISVLDALTVYPVGSAAGFVIQDINALAEVDLFESLTICTYLDGTLQECQSANTLLSIELLTNLFAPSSDVYNVGFISTLPYNEIQISVGSLASVLNIIRVYGAFVDVQTVTDTLFNCCPTLPPTLSDNELSNICPDEFVNLNSLVTNSAPVNSILVWFDGVDPSVANQLDEPEMVLMSGIYYPFFYNNTDPNDCYSPAGDSVVVTITECCVTPFLTLSSPEACSNALGTYAISFITNADSLAVDFGVLVGNTITEIPLGEAVVVTAYNTLNCSTTLISQGLLSCPENCVPPTLNVGNGVCNGDSTYSVAFSVAPLTAVTTNFGTIVDNNVVGIPLGVNVILTSGSGDCEVSVEVVPPTNCDVICESPFLSVSAGVCDGSEQGDYEVYFVLQDGATIDVSHGVVVDNTITQIPNQTNVLVTASLAGCGSQSILITAPENCPECVDPLLILGSAVACDSINGFYEVTFLTNAQNIDVSAGVVDGNSIIEIPIGTDVTVVASNSGACSTTLMTTSPIGCPTDCVSPILYVGNGACDGFETGTYSVAFSVLPNSQVVVSAGVVDGNSVIDIPVGEDLIISAGLGDCISILTVSSPTNCDDPCSTPQVSLSNAVCQTDIDGNYMINYVLSPGANIQVSEGTVTNGAIIDIPNQVDVLVTVSFEGCSAQEILILAPENCFNMPPVAVDDTASVFEDGEVIINIIGNDFDPDGELDTLSIDFISLPEFGTVINNNDGTVTYTPEPNFVGVDSFTYIICDNGDPVLCDSAVVVINVIPVTDTTIITTDEDTPIVLCIDTLVNFGNFTIEDLILCNLPGNGTVVIIDNSTCIEYTPDDDWYGTDTLCVIACANGVCDTSIVIVIVLPINDPPIANNDTVTALAMDPVEIDVVANDTDIDGNIDPTTVTIVVPPTQGSATVDPVTGVITYTAFEGACGMDSLQYMVFDDGFPLPTLSDVAWVFIELIDNIPPTILCPSDIQVNALNNTCWMVVSFDDAIVTDNCDSDNVFVSYIGVPNANLFPIGENVIEVIATDASGNSATCEFIVNVIDIQPPVINICPIDIVVNNLTDSCGAHVGWIMPTVFDNCDYTLTNWVEYDPASGMTNGSVISNLNNYFPVGTSIVTYVAEDMSGGVDSCTFTVTVNDTQAPQFVSAPTNTTIFTNVFDCNANFTWPAPVVIDNCVIDSVWFELNGEVNVNPGTFPVGETTVSYFAVDMFGNIATYVFTITVVDTISPAISNCPENIVVLVEDKSCGAFVSWDDIVATDNCSISTVTSTQNSGDYFDVGDWQVTITATDNSGNQSVCEFTVSVVDNIPPVFTNVPGDFTICVNDTANFSIENEIMAQVTAIDNCGILSIEYADFTWVLDANVVVITAMDVNGNTSDTSVIINLFPIEEVALVSDSISTCSGQIVTFSVANPNAAYTYVWSQFSGFELGTGSSFQFNPVETYHSGGYVVTATTSNGCSSSAVLVLQVNNCVIDIPEFISPDGDGFNDVFFIENLEAYPGTAVSIFNRWGALIYESEDYLNDWDGTSQSKFNVGGDALPEGTYYYVLTLGGNSSDDSFGEVYKGYVFLKR